MTTEISSSELRLFKHLSGTVVGLIGYETYSVNDITRNLEDGGIKKPKTYFLAIKKETKITENMFMYLGQSFPQK